MSIPIHNIEHYFNENLVLVAENLLDKNLAGDLHRLEQGVWTAEVQGFEVEIQLKASKIVAHTCECPSTEPVCSHLVAAAMLLRKKLISDEQEKKEKKANDFIPKKLNISSILKYASEDELKDFLREYARGDKKFSSVLKAHFIHQVEVYDPYKYLTFLKGILSKGELNKPTFAAARRLKKTYDILQNKADESIILGHMLEAWLNAKAILEFHHPVAQRENVLKVNFNEQIECAIAHIDRIYKLSTVIELKEEIEAYVQEEVLKGQYRRIYDNAFNQWIQLIGKFNSSPVEEIFQLCQTYILENGRNQDSKINCFKHYYRLLKKENRLEELYNFTSQAELSPFLLVQFADNLSQLEEGEVGLHILNQRLQSKQSEMEKKILYPAVFEIALRTNKKDLLLKTGVECMLSNTDIHYYESLMQTKIKGLSENKIKSYFQKAISNIESKDAQTKLYAQFYLCNEDYTSYFKFMDNEGSIDLHIKYCHQIPEDYNKEHKELLKQLVSIYLENHFGDKPAVKLRKIFAILHDNEQNKLSQDLERFINKKFSNRKRLIEDIFYY